MNSTELTNKAKALTETLDGKRLALTDAMLDGKDTGKLLDEIARLENETKATLTAAGIAKQREAQAVEAARLAEVKRMEAKADELHQVGIQQAAELLETVLGLAEAIGELRGTGEEESKIISQYALKKPRLMDGEGELFLAKGIVDLIQRLMVNKQSDGVYAPESPSPIFGMNNREALALLTATLEKVKPSLKPVISKPAPVPARKPRKITPVMAAFTRVR